MLNSELSAKERHCLHLERRVIKRKNEGLPSDDRPDLVLWICHLPSVQSSSIQCTLLVRGISCPHNGPYGKN